MDNITSTEKICDDKNHAANFNHNDDSKGGNDDVDDDGIDNNENYKDSNDNKDRGDRITILGTILCLIDKTDMPVLLPFRIPPLPPSSSLLFQTIKYPHSAEDLNQQMASLRPPDRLLNGAAPELNQFALGSSEPALRAHFSLSWGQIRTS